MTQKIRRKEPARKWEGIALIATQTKDMKKSLLFLNLNEDPPYKFEGKYL